MPKLTKRTVDAAHPRASRYELTCSALSGFLVRVLPSGSKIFFARYRRGGRSGGQRRVRIGVYSEGLTVDQARRAARTILADVAKGQDPGGEIQERRQSESFADAADRFMREHASVHLKPRTVHSYRLLLNKHLLPAFGPRKIGEIQRADVERFHSRVGATSPGAANRALALLSVLCTRAEVWGIRPQHSNPCRFVKRFRERKFERFLSADERAQLHEALVLAARRQPGERGYVTPGAIAAIRLLELTGARLSEITGLTWHMVDWQGQRLRLADSKTGPVLLPLSSPTLALLRELHEHKFRGSEYVCTSATGRPLQNMARAWRVICREAGLEGVRLHDLRHSAASDAIMSGVPLEIVGKMLGHRSMQTTRRYAHIADEALRAGVERAGAAIVGARGGDVVPLRRAGDASP